MVDVASNATTTARFEVAAGSQPMDGSYSGLFETEGDTDWIAVSLTSGNDYAFLVSSLTTATSQTAAILYNGAGQQVGFSGFSDRNVVTFNPGTSGVYYLAVQADISEIGSYDVFFSRQAGTAAPLGDGNDTASGAAGTWVLAGKGDDTITLVPAGATRAAGEQGNDKLFGSVNSDELTGGAGNDVITGGGLFDRLFGDAGNDTVSGGDGADLIMGNDGNDTLSGDADNDTIRGGLGADKIGGGTGKDNLFGGEGNDAIDAGSGVGDILSGGNGNDVYTVHDVTQIVTELFTSGTDLLVASVSRSITASSVLRGTVENLTLIGAGAINGTGNALANTIKGNNAANILIGLVGKDMLTGGGGNDTFKYVSKLDSHGTTVDVVLDFDDAGNDRIDLSAVYAGTLVYRGSGAFTGGHQVRINDISGPHILVEVNISGSLAPELVIRLASTTAASMNAGDFVL